MKRILAVFASIGLLVLVGCENDNSSVVTNEAPGTVVNVPTGTVTMATVNTTGNGNTTIVYIESAPGVTQVYEVNTIGNSNLLGFFSSGPMMAPATPATTTDPAAP